MILQKEIATISEQLGVSKSVIDKDWMLGHFIAAIFNEPELKETLIFKGGTCLKKCWFEEYRFSEDLDFTSKSQEFELTPFARNCIPCPFLLATTRKQLRPQPENDFMIWGIVTNCIKISDKVIYQHSMFSLNKPIKLIMQ